MEPISFEPRPNPQTHRSKSSKENELERGQEKIADLAKSDKGFLGRLAGKAKQKILKAGIAGGQFVYRHELEKQEADARAFLQKHVIGIDQIDQQLPQELDGIIQFLRQVGVPLAENEIGADPQSKHKRLITSLVWIVVGNLSRQVIAENDAPISSAELTDRAVRHLMHFFGERTNHLEATYGIGNIPKEAFIPMSNELLAQILPIDGYFIDKFKPKASLGLAAIYEAIQGLIAGKPSKGKTDLTPIMPLIKSVDHFILESVVENSLKRDQVNLAKSTGQTVQELSRMTDQLAKQLDQHLSKQLTEKLKDFLPADSELMRKTFKAVLTKLCMHTAQNFEHQNLDHPHTIEGILGLVQGKLQAAYADPNPEAALNLSRELIALILPPDVPYAGEFVKRYEHHFLPVVNDTISTLFAHLKAQPQALKDAKEKIAAKVKNPDPLMALVEVWNDKATSMVAELAQKNASSNPLMSVGLKVLSVFDEQAKVALKATVLKIFTQMIPDPAPGAQWDSSEVFAKVLDRLHGFANEKVRHVTDALKDVADEQERLERARELSLPLMKDFIRSFVTADVLGEIPLPEKYRAIAYEKIEESINELIAAELVKATQRAIDHPKEPGLADAIFTIQQQLVTANVRLQETKKSLFRKIDGFESLTQFLDEQVDAVSEKGAAALMTLGQSDAFSEEQLRWIGATSKPLATFIKGWVWKIFEKMIPEPADGKKFSLEEVIPKILESFEKFADDQFPGFLQEAKKGHLDPQRLQQLSKPILKEFIKRFISDNLAADIPLPGIYQKNVVGVIEDLLLDKMNETILRYVNNANDAQIRGLTVYGKYKPFLPPVLQNSLDPIFEEGLKKSKFIDEAKETFRAKVENPESIIGVIDQFSQRASAFGSEHIMRMMGEKFLKAKGSRILKPLEPKMKEFIQGWIWKILVRLIPTPPNGKKIKAEELLPRIFDNFVQFANGHFPDLIETVKRDWKDLSAEERKKQALKLNMPILQAFLKQFISDDLAAEIPLPEKYRAVVVQKIEASLNDFVSDALVASCGWMLEKQENEAALNRMFKSSENQPSAPVKACHAAGKIIQSAIPYQCREKGNTLAQSVYEMLRADLPDGKPSQQIASAGKKMVLSLFDYVGLAKSQEVKDALSFVSTYAETALLRLSRQLGERVERLDHALVEGDSSTMEKFIGIFIKELEPHLRVYGENRKLFRKDDRKKILEAFRSEGLLHAGMGDATDRDVVFKTWSAKILAIAGLHSGAPLPVPPLFRDEAWKQLQDTLLPSLLVTAFDKMKDPHMLDKMLRIALQKFNADWNKDKVAIDHVREVLFPAATKDYKAQVLKVRKFDDAYQIEMEKKFGELGRLLLKLHSSPVVGTIMRSKKLQKKVGELIGQPLRGNLRTATNEPERPGQAVTINQVLGSSLEAFVDHFVPCERVGDQWNYFAMDAEGNVTDAKLDEPDLSELFPTNAEEKARLHIRDVTQRAVLQRQVMKGTRRLIKDQLQIMMQGLLNAPWDAMVNGFVRLLRAIVLTKHKDKVENGVRKFFWFLRRYVIFPVLAIVTLPVWLPIREIMNAVLTNKGTKHVQGLKDNIHMNLAYRFVDGLVHKLEADVRRKEAHLKNAP